MIKNPNKFSLRKLKRTRGNRDSSRFRKIARLEADCPHGTSDLTTVKIHSKMSKARNRTLVWSSFDLCGGQVPIISTLVIEPSNSTSETVLSTNKTPITP